MPPKILHIDMDDTIADFKGHPAFDGRPVDSVNVSHMFEPGFFRDLKPVAGALVAVRALIRMGFDVQILTQPVAESPHCYAEKVQWIAMWFPELVGKINMTQDKGLVRGHFLVDDNREKWENKFQAHGGKFVHFRYDQNHEKEWERILQFFDSMSSSDLVKD